MTSHEFSAESPRAYAEIVLARAQDALRSAVTVVSPETPEADPLSVFEPPTEVRDEAVGLTLTVDQEQQLRAAAAELGFGRTSDRTLSEQGLTSPYVIIEGGQPHKMMAEALMVLDDDAATPTTIFFTASPFRRITNSAEAASAERIIGRPAATEYDAAMGVIAALPGFVADKTGTVLPISYDIDNDFAVGNRESGQFFRVGQIEEVPVIIVSVDREDYTDEVTGKSKYRKQPGAGNLLRIIDMADEGHHTPVAFVTSSTYEASRNVDAARVALQTGTMMVVASYGTERLGAVKGEAAEAAHINQLPGELYKTAKQVNLLQRVLDGQQ